MLDVHRNWMAQSVDGGADIYIPGWAIEVKRHKTTARINDWWTQCAAQALKATQRPCLLYRVDRGVWFAMMSLYDLRPDLNNHTQVTMKLEAWCVIVRREMDAQS